ncbi:selenide, water dikinase SelD [Leptolyngbya sp. 'hensonii']|uniref:selenide, water dikinase SelD n=1 Tax=Leptolyngbya sp. 'hensonii' TaxID=1922337 RepID=UPI0009501122|nr:selenide, water dikinase SelD [Leptolyngbya sp. 'hensonii']OLP15548.1 selenide, water dikinase SelD [Leptolyngbya sp. 'hensonii']
MIRLTQYSHGGGCGCKIAPEKLQQILHQVPLDLGNDRLLVGAGTSDDAAVYLLNPDQALVLTTDFFMPIVDDPVDFGRIAATNALSDVYAMGGTPILALTILGMPINKLPTEVIQAIMQGGAAVCQSAGIPLAGGHSIDSPEPIFGLVAAGIVHPQHLRQNSTAQVGDRLILTKPLGIGVMTTALKKEKLSPEAYREVLTVMTQLNRVGIQLGANPMVHAMTDVTGFGLLGHLLEVCRGSKVKAQITASKIPILSPARTLAAQGIFPGAAERNWNSYRDGVILALARPDWETLLLTDPQTSGGLLLAVAPEGVADILTLLAREGYEHATVIGECKTGTPGIEVQ